MRCHVAGGRGGKFIGALYRAIQLSGMHILLADTVHSDTHLNAENQAQPKSTLACRGGNFFMVHNFCEILKWGSKFSFKFQDPIFTHLKVPWVLKVLGHDIRPTVAAKIKLMFVLCATMV